MIEAEKTAEGKQLDIKSILEMLSGAKTSSEATFKDCSFVETYGTNVFTT